MKTNIHCINSRILALASALLFMGYAHASNGILLDVDMKGCHKPHTGKDSAEEHRRWLEISAAAMSLTTPTQVTLEWHFFADDLSAKEVIEHAKGSEIIEMQPGKNTDITTKETVFSYTREHSERASSGRRVSYKRVEATGTRFHGWGVRALIDGKVVAEAFSSRDIAKHMEEP
jgi:hypothetical protein